MLILALLILFMRPRQETAADQIESIKNYMNSVGMMFVCVTAFLGVYADEIRTGSMIGVIGRGMHRRKVLLAKLIEAGIILLLVLRRGVSARFLDNESAALGVTRRQELFLLIYCLYTVIRGSTARACFSDIVCHMECVRRNDDSGYVPSGLESVPENRSG